ncbi:MAG: archease [Candidatus Micrarchaeia archaeon]
MRTYRYLEHRSDLLIEGSGRTIPEALESVAQGLFNSISSASLHQSGPVTITFTESGIDVQDLIINIFTRVLAEMDAQSKVGTSLKVLSFDDEKHTAEVELVLCDGKAKLHVKAVTFHEFQLIKSSNGLTSLRILFDI